jgi:hypothetical protein
MTAHIEILSTLLQEILDRELSTEADFATLTATGEQLRRAVQMLEEPAEQAVALMRRYDERIAKFEHQTLPRLFEILGNVVADLDQYMSDERDQLVGQDLLLALDDVLSIASALARTGHLKEADVNVLAEQATTAIASRASRLPELWQFAENREHAFGPDEQAPQRFAFWDELAYFAATRTATFTAVKARRYI